MRRILRAILLLSLLPLLLPADTYDERTLVRIQVPERADREFILSSRIDVVNAGAAWVKALLRPGEFRLVEERGLYYEVLQKEMDADRALWREADAASAAHFATAYYTASKFNTTNPAAGTLMEHLNTLHNSHPAITRLYNLGATQDGNYDIIAMQVSLNPDTVEAEPKIRIYGNIHGDEKSGLMVACDVLDWILANYGSNPSAQKLVNEAELWFIPMGNPYGNANNTRYNVDNVDLNRNFWGPAGSDEPPAWSEKETQAVRDLTETATAAHTKKRFTTSISFHAGDICFNSVWNYTSAAPTDEPIFWSSRTGGPNGGAMPAANGLAKAYEDGCTTSGFWYTEGYDWYQTLGDTNDWAYGAWTDLDTTIELTVTKTPPTSEINAFCAEHRQAVINYMLKTFQGIHGVMKDSITNAPLDGTVTAVCTSAAHTYQAVYTDPVAGDFHRVLQPGTYTITCSAAGYHDTVIPGLVVTADTKTVSNCVMSPTGPEMTYQSNTWTDACSGTGSGAGNGYLDAGEDITMHPTLKNTGSLAATGITATLSTGTAGISITGAAAAYPDLAAGASGVCASPHFAFRVGTGVACGTVINFTLSITAASGGPWTQNFSMTVGQVLPGGGTLFSENFDGVTAPAVPAGWAQTDTSGTAGTWATNAGTRNPSGGGTNTAPNVAYFNSYTSASGSATRFYRTSGFAIPAGATAAAWTFYMYHDNAYATDNDTLQPQVSVNGGATWVNVGTAIARYAAVNAWTQHTLSLNAYIGQADVRLAFVGTSAYGNDCHIDTVAVTYSAAGGCTMSACTPSASGPKPVPDGRLGGTAMKGARVTTNGSTISVTYDTSTCTMTDHSILFGNLAGIATLTPAGGACSIGNTSPYGWSSVPTGYDVWWVVVGDGGTTESSWGQKYTGGAYSQRRFTASGQCGNTAIDTTGTCP